MKRHQKLVFWIVRALRLQLSKDAAIELPIFKKDNSMNAAPNQGATEYNINDDDGKVVDNF